MRTVRSSLSTVEQEGRLAPHEKTNRTPFTGCRMELTPDPDEWRARMRADSMVVAERIALSVELQTATVARSSK